jgi:hypothetical protein
MAARQAFVARDSLLPAVALAARKYEREATDREPRKYTWCADLGRAEIEVRFSAQVTRTLRVGTTQMLALVFFNTHTIGSTAQLVKATGVARDSLISALLALAHPKVAVLLKRPNCRDAKPDDRWCLNSRYGSSPTPPSSSASSSSSSFSSSSSPPSSSSFLPSVARTDAVIVVPLRIADSSARAVVTQIEQSEQDAERQRFVRHRVDAAIVREMKTRRVVSDDQLFKVVAAALGDTRRVVITRDEYAARVKALVADGYLEAVEIPAVSSPQFVPSPTPGSGFSPASLSVAPAPPPPPLLPEKGYRYLT